jgi:Domain of unknown function (DUF3943)
MSALRFAALASLLCLPIPAVASVGHDAPPQAVVHTEPRPYDRRGIKRDTVYFLGYQFVAVGIISVWPRDETKYEEKIGWESWIYNVTHPEWDTDRFVVNYVLHPYWGAAYYVRGRERGLSREQAFWYSTLLSSIFEFGAEAMVEKPSYQDLLVTPTLGSLLGEYLFWPMRERILAKTTPLDTADKVTLVLIDPLGAINSGVDRLFGVKAEVAFAPIIEDQTWSRRFRATGGVDLPPLPRAAGSVGWGLQVRLQW